MQEDVQQEVMDVDPTSNKQVQQQFPRSPSFKSAHSLRQSISLNRFSTFEVATDTWSPQRTFIAGIVSHKAFEILLGVLVLCSISLGIVEADHKADGDEVPPWIPTVEVVLLILYCMEVVSRVYVLRWKFFQSSINAFDLCVVLLDVVFAFVRLTDIELPQITFMRVLRLMKLSRVFHILASQPQLSIFLEAFAASLKTILFGCFFIGIALVVYGILAVEIMFPLKPEFSTTCVRCPFAFHSVFESICTLFQTVIVGDEWAEVFRPFLAEHPETLFYVFPVFVTVHLGLMNLMMAVVVDTAHEARTKNIKRVTDEKTKEFQRNAKKLRHVCAQMDTDGSGTITQEEMIDGYENNMEFRRTLNAMDIGAEDLVAVFNILDEDSSGEVDAEEFVRQFHKMKHSDSHTLLIFIKHYVTDLRKKVSEELCIMKSHVTTGIEQLQKDLAEEIVMLKENMELTASALQASKQENEILLKEEQLLKTDIELHRQFLNATQPMVEFPRLPSLGQSDCQLPELRAQDSTRSAEHVAVSSQLRVASEKIGSDLKDLRCKCEKSAVLLTTFMSLLPDSKELSLRSPAEIGDQQRSDRSTDVWNFRYCCTSPVLPHSGPGFHSPGRPAISGRLLVTPSGDN